MSNQDTPEIGALLFFGNPMEAIPRRLIASTGLSNEEKVCWMLIKVLSEHSRVRDLENSEQLAQMLFNDPGATHQLQEVLLKLRLGRWLTHCGDSFGGSSLYGIHDESAPVHEVIKLDPSYPVLVEAATQHEREDIRQLACSILAQLLPSSVADAG